MTHFVWMQEYSVGDATLDAQHQELIRLMSELHALLQTPGATDARQAEKIFDGLAAYIVRHFAYEEQRMGDAGYPVDKLATHRAEHSALIRQVQEYHARVATGDLDGLRELLPFLYGEWLIQHICENDQDYIGYLQQTGTATA